MTNGGGPHGHKKGKAGGPRAGVARDTKAAGKKVLTAGLPGKPAAKKPTRAGG